MPHIHNQKHISQTKVQSVSIMLKRALPKILIKTVIMTVILFILTLPSIKLFAITNIGLTTAFSSPIFISSFIVLFTLFSIYDFVTSRKVWGLENVIAILLVTMLLAGLPFSILLIIISFILILFGLMAGASIRQVSFRQKGMTRTINGSVMFLFIIWVTYVFLTNSNYYVPPSNQSINLNRPYLTQQQLGSIYGSGVYSQSVLNAGEIPIGQLNLLFPTPISTLLFNFTFQNTNAGNSYYITYYNHTYNTNFTELVVETPQASIILADQAPHAQQSGSINNIQYIQDSTTNPNSFTALVQQSNFLAIVSCSGSLCTQKAFNNTVQAIGIGIK